jgi:hypothetical protein
MSLAAARKGKLLHFKVVAGVETVTEIGTAASEIGMTIVEHAIYYAGRGWPVLPCDPTDKRPWFLMVFIQPRLTKTRSENGGADGRTR